MNGCLTKELENYRLSQQLLQLTRKKRDATSISDRGLEVSNDGGKISTLNCSFLPGLSLSALWNVALTVDNKIACGLVLLEIEGSLIFPEKLSPNIEKL